MAQLRDSIVQGSLRVTDTIFTNSLTASDLITARALEITDTNAVSHITLSRSSYNYLSMPAGSELVFVSGTTIGAEYGIRMKITNNPKVTGGYIYPGVTNVMTLGSSDLKWSNVWSTKINNLTLTAATTGFTIAGGTTSKTLTVSETYTLGAACAKEVVDRTSVSSLTNVDTWANNANLPTVNLIAYWDGRYQKTNNKSNLAYCVKGAFGDMAIKTKGNGFSDSSNTISVAYGTAANTAVQGNQTIFTLNGGAKNSGSSASFYAPTAAGTSGQYLKSTAGTPEWATFSSSTVGLGNVTNDAQVKASLGTAKGDMIYWSAANTPARLGIGTTNHILIATADGPRWTASASLASATSTTANTDAWDTLTLGNNVNRTSTSAHSSGRIILYGTATAGTTISHGSWSGSGLTVGGSVVGQSNAAFIVSGASDPNPYIRFDTRAGTSSLGTGSTTYTTIAQTSWAFIYCTIPTRKNTYATAGNASSTVTYNYTSYPTRFFFRQYSYTAAAAARVGKYEDYRLPAVNADRTGNATYDIITTKNLSSITSVNGATFAGTAAASYIATFSGTTDATSSAGAVIINGGLLVKKKLYVTSTLTVAGATTLSGALTVAGATTLNGKLVGSSNNYGATLPSSGQTTGQIFFQTSDPVYELPTGGTTGQALVKASNTNRDVQWGGPYLPLTGGTVSGLITMSKASGESWYIAERTGGNRTAFGIGYGGVNRGVYDLTLDKWIIYCDGTNAASQLKLYGAVWNDYAEFRKDNPNENLEAGRCVSEIGDGSLRLTQNRLELGCEIVSDTFGFAIGQDKENGYNTPIASSGRVLAYPFEGIEDFRSHIGWPVCSGPNGTVSIMTKEEEQEYPSRIIGTISEIPSYNEWGTDKVKVNGRVWIRIR